MTGEGDGSEVFPYASAQAFGAAKVSIDVVSGGGRSADSG
jgi:hypothetical protein